MFLCLLFSGAALVYFYLIPDLQAKKQKVSEIQANIASTNQEIEEFKLQIAEVNKYKGLLSALEGNRFINNQDRILAAEVLESLRSISRLNNIVYTVSPAVYNDVFEGKGQVISSEINFDVQAMMDKDVYDFIFLLSKSLPGFITVSKLSIRRIVNSIDESVLDSIRRKSSRELLTATFTINWYSFIQTPIAAPSADAAAQLNPDGLSSTGGAQ